MTENRDNKTKQGHAFTDEKRKKWFRLREYYREHPKEAAKAMTKKFDGR